MKSTLIKILAGLIVVGGGYYAYTSSNSSPNVINSAKESLSVVDKLLSGDSYKCVSNIAAMGTVTQATSYAANKMIRTDATMQVAGQTVDTSMLMRDNVMYTWNSKAPLGFKMAFNESEYRAQMEEGKDAKAQDAYTKDGADIAYSCEKWTADMTKFEVPKNITFSEMKAPAGVGGNANNTAPQMSKEDIEKMMKSIEGMAR